MSDYFSKSNTGGAIASRGFTYQDYCSLIELFKVIDDDNFKAISIETIDDFTIIMNNDKEILFQVKKMQFDIKIINEVLDKNIGNKQQQFIFTSKDSAKYNGLFDKIIEYEKSVISSRTDDEKEHIKNEIKKLIEDNKILNSDKYLQSKVLLYGEDNIYDILSNKCREWLDSKEFIIIDIDNFLDKLRLIISDKKTSRDELKKEEFYEIVNSFKSIDNNKRNIFPKCDNLNKIFFTNYTNKNEAYYLERDVDNSFNKTLDINNIWVFGKSGRGKTALINRNLINNNLKYIYCDLSPINIYSSDDILEEIIGTIEEQFEIERCTKEKNKIKLIVKLLKQIMNSKIIIVIDEMSVSDKKLLKSIATSFISLVTHYNNNGYERNLKFIISTIAEPKKIILNITKASEYFEYICCDNWKEDIDKLFDYLNKSLELNIIEPNKALIIDSSKESPRVLKNIFRKLTIEDNLNHKSIQVIIDKTLEESL